MLFCNELRDTTQTLEILYDAFRFIEIITTEQRNLDTLSLKQEISQVINTLRVKQESIMFNEFTNNECLTIHYSSKMIFFI